MRVLAIGGTIPGSCVVAHRRTGDAERLRAEDHVNTQASFGYVTPVSIRSSLIHDGGTSHTVRPSSRRSGTIPLEQQAAAKFALAMLVGFGAIVANLSTSVTALLLIVAVLVMGRSLVILGGEPTDRTSVRPTTEASWDSLLASAWGVLALILAADGSAVGALVAGVGAVALAFLRLRTRYVI